MADKETLRALQQKLQHLEALRDVLDEAAFEKAKAALQTQIHAEVGIAVSGTVSGGVVTGDGNVASDGHVIIVGEGARVVIGEEPVTTPALDFQSALSRYLRHVISHNRYLRLQGIRSGGKLISIELEKIYVTLRATRRRTVVDERDWLEAESEHTPGESKIWQASVSEQPPVETITVGLSEALNAARRLVVLGDPGCGKTTLLRYLALLYARDLAEGNKLIIKHLGIMESGQLPIIVPLRRLGAYLKAHWPVDSGTDGHTLLLTHTLESLKAERISLPKDFFYPYLESGKAIILLDGLDEVADPNLRRRVARLIESFTAAYPGCRYVVSSRIVGYMGAARLGKNYVTTTVRNFTLADIEQFLSNWHLAVAVGQMGPGESARDYAHLQTQQLVMAIQANERIRELAINPLMLTVIALVHRDRVKLPERRAELYAETIDVLLGKWDEARGIAELKILENRSFDAGDKRLLLQHVALWMHERAQKEIEIADLHQILAQLIYDIVQNWDAANKAVDRFLHIIQERTGLLNELGVGIYRFSHLTFQEYLAAVAIAGRDDYVAYTLKHANDPWWREVILLEAGYLSMQSRVRTTSLIQALLGLQESPDEPYHHLVLAAGALQEVGSGRVSGNLEAEIQKRLSEALESPPPPLARWLLKFGVRGWIERRVQAKEALIQIGGVDWERPYGEPKWIKIPGGHFYMGGEKEAHRVTLDDFLISRTPITNAQYYLFIEATGYRTPHHWVSGSPSKDQWGYPVVNISWHDALAYCQWLSTAIDKYVTLPSEAEWEKAARGTQDQRNYPWGDNFEAIRCNCKELGLDRITPVGIFLEGASPYGCLDMAGNIWEWTRSLWGEREEEPTHKYPYNPSDGRENLHAGDDIYRILRGGAFNDTKELVKCTVRGSGIPYQGGRYGGFRVVALPSPLIDYERGLAFNQVLKFFQQAEFSIEQVDWDSAEIIINIAQKTSHSKYGNILVKTFSDNLSGHHIREIEKSIRTKNVSTEIAYTIYEGELSTGAFLQMGSYKTEEDLTIVPLKAEVISDILASQDITSYYRSLTSLEQEYLGHFNRYDESNAIQDPTWFFGRRREIDELVDRLQAYQHAGVFGMRKIGKSSLLFHLKQRLSRKSIPVAYLGLQSGSVEPVKLLQNIIQQLRFVLQAMGIKDLPESKLLHNEVGPIAGYVFEEEIKALWHTAKRKTKTPFMVVIIDEVDRIVPRSQDTIDYQKYDAFFAPIRNLSQTERCLVSVVAAERPIIREEFDPKFGTNTMFELYDERYLSCFSYDECCNMVIKIGKWMGIEYSPESLQRIFEESGGHPYIARALCACIVNGSGAKEISVQDVDAAIDATLGKLKEYFRAWQKKLSDAEQEIVVSILKTHTLPPRMDDERIDACEHLQKQGIIHQNESGQWAMTIQLLKRWLEPRIGV